MQRQTAEVARRTPAIGALTTDRVAEEDREKVNHLILTTTLPRKAYVLVDLAENTMFLKRSADHHDLPKPGRVREVGLRSRRDFHRGVGDTVISPSLLRTVV